MNNTNIDFLEIDYYNCPSRQLNQKRNIFMNILIPFDIKKYLEKKKVNCNEVYPN